MTLEKTSEQCPEFQITSSKRDGGQRKIPSSFSPLLRYTCNTVTFVPSHIHPRSVLHSNPHPHAHLRCEPMLALPMVSYIKDDALPSSWSACTLMSWRPRPCLQWRDDCATRWSLDHNRKVEMISSAATISMPDAAVDT